MLRFGALGVLTIVLAGCGDDDGTADTDAAMGGDSSIEPMGIAPPAPPDLACPDGWRVVTSETGIVTCDPWPEAGRVDCAPHEAWFPGGAGCERVGSECPAGDFPAGLPADTPIRYVAAGAAAGGDGTVGSPFARIREAMSGAAAGSVIALGRGRYEEIVQPRAAVTVWGACTEATEIATTVASERAGVIDPLADVVVRNLRIGPSARAGVRVVSAHDVQLEDVVVEGATALGLGAQNGGHIDGDGVVVRGSRPDARGGFGRGAIAQSGGSITLTRTVFSGNRDVAVSTQFDGARVELSDVVVRDTGPNLADSARGRGLAVQEGASGTVVRGVFERSREVAIFVFNPGSTLVLEDVVSREGLEELTDLEGGRGLGVQQGAQARVDRCLFEDNRGDGIFVEGVDTSLALTDVVVRRTESRVSDGMSGRGINAQSGAVVDVVRAALEGNREIAFLAASNAVVTVEDLTVRDTREQEADGAGGRGFTAQTGATATVTRALLERNRALGFNADQEGGSLLLSDVVVRDMESQLGNGRFGRALSAQLGGTVDVQRALFENTRDVAVLAAAQASITLSSVRITGVQPQECATSTCTDMPFGMGIGAYYSASVSVSDFDLEGAELCGAQVAESGEIDLADGEIRGCSIGACIQVDGYDLDRLTSNVSYRDNGTSLEATSFPVPDSTTMVPTE